MAELIDGKSIAAKIRAQVREEVLKMSRGGLAPTLAVILVGNDPASEVYVAQKEKALCEVGMKGETFRLSADASESEVLRLISKLNEDSKIHGILVQLPLPSQIDSAKVVRAISPEKDVDGFHFANAGKMLLGEKCFVPCTPLGILTLLQECGAQIRGANVVVVGRSNLVGRPISILLSQKPFDATVTVCHSATRDLADFARRADILVAAIGKPRFIRADMIKKGAVVIDVGVNRIPDATKKTGTRLVGDVDFDEAEKIASKITPVPGGVGPMTIAMLLKNVLQAAKS